MKTSKTTTVDVYSNGRSVAQALFELGEIKALLFVFDVKNVAEWAHDNRIPIENVLAALKLANADGNLKR